MLLYLGDHSRAESVFSEALALWRTQENPLQTAITLIGLEGAANGVQHSQERESALLHQALALSRTLDDPKLAAFVASMVHATLGMAANSRGQYALAHDLHLKALRLRREVNYTLGAYLSLDGARLRWSRETTRGTRVFSGSSDAGHRALESTLHRGRLH